MKLRCPYCRAGLESRPANGACPHCGRFMLPPPDRAAAEARRARRRAFDRIAREADRKRASMSEVPTGRGLHGPRVLIVAVALLAVLGGSLVSASRKAVERAKEEPHLRAVHELDALAAALGRFKFHVGRYPREGEGGLEALVRDDLGGEWNTPDKDGVPRIAGWIGPYVNVVHADPWGRPYLYEAGDDAVVRLASLGPDGLAGTPDDLSPDPASYDVGTDWTNGWVHARDRMPGYWVAGGGAFPPDGAGEGEGQSQGKGEGAE